MNPKNKPASGNIPAEPGERLVKFLSSAGIASRRAAADLVGAGRVRVNGAVETGPGRRIFAGDRVECDGRPVAPPAERHYIMLNKPCGYVCSSSDPHAEHLALELIRLPEPARLFSAGRLDKESEGLILFSDDGDFVARLTHPRNRILKTYLVTTARPLSAAELARIRGGIEDDGELLRVHAAESLGGCRYRFLLNEGRKREIRRLTLAVGARTVRLRRIAVGNLTLGGLAPGKWRELSAAERRAALTADAAPDQPRGGVENRN